jgi:hypothetical protein
LLFALGINFFPAFQLHYLGAVTCLFVLVSVVGLQQISRLSPESARLILFLCLMHSVFWYGVHVFDSPEILRFETWDSINHTNPERRILVSRQLAEVPGRILVFVRYSPQHIFQNEWVYNEAEIDAARIIWARDLGPTENEKLRAHYFGRVALLLEPDANPPLLNPYSP